ncbi:DsrH/TusB family sulfur relay protein [Allohahella marinimesophila]|uniref:tRNA 2-thiouridine synthesizing protein C n=1 Tax=Allohahella marinimesophila TaxID=1054972 RepID=A0ABP7NKX7_9GAMM
MLHIFTLGLDAGSQLEHCLALMGSKDALLLIEDGVYWSHPSEASGRLWAALGLANDLDPQCYQAPGEPTPAFATEPHQVMVLKADCTARGIADASLPGDAGRCFQLIDFDRFVELTEHHIQSMTWY